MFPFPDDELSAAHCIENKATQNTQIKNTFLEQKQKKKIRNRLGEEEKKNNTYINTKT